MVSQKSRLVLLLSLLLVGLLAMTGCEALHRDIPAFGDDPDAGEGADVNQEVNQNGCVPGGTCGPCDLGTISCEGDQQTCVGPVDLNSDDEHCGVCENACGIDESCVLGDCISDDICVPDVPCGTCGTGNTACSPGGERSCAGGEIDLQTDPDFCGDCDTACEPGEPCVAGACEPPPQLTAIACPGQVTLLWDEMAGASSYVVQWSTSTAGGSTTIQAREGASGITTQATQISLDFTTSTTLFFRVSGRVGATQVGQTAWAEVSFPGGTTSGVVNTAGDLIVPEGETFVGDGSVEKTGSIVIDGTVCVERLVVADGGEIQLIAPMILVGETGAVSASAAGPGGGGTACTGSPGAGGGGGSYGGAGDAVCGGGGGPYGDATSATIQMGSGGGGTTQGAGEGGGGAACGARSNSGGRGGGAIHLAGDEIAVAGALVASGSGTFGTCTGHLGGSGSGGGILIEGGDVVIEATARVLADGGSLGQSGGGGRVKVLGVVDELAGSILRAAGGSAAAGDGTVHVD